MYFIFGAACWWEEHSQSTTVDWALSESEQRIRCVEFHVTWYVYTLHSTPMPVPHKGSPHLSSFHTMNRVLTNSHEKYDGVVQRFNGFDKSWSWLGMAVGSSSGACIPIKLQYFNSMLFCLFSAAFLLFVPPISHGRLPFSAIRLRPKHTHTHIHPIRGVNFSLNAKNGKHVPAKGLFPLRSPLKSLRCLPHRCRLFICAHHEPGLAGDLNAAQTL